MYPWNGEICYIPSLSWVSWYRGQSFIGIYININSLYNYKTDKMLENVFYVLIIPLSQKWNVPFQQYYMHVCNCMPMLFLASVTHILQYSAISYWRQFISGIYFTNIKETIEMKTLFKWRKQGKREYQKKPLALRYINMIGPDVMTL